MIYKSILSPKQYRKDKCVQVQITKQNCAHSSFSRVGLPEEEGGFSLLLLPQQGQRQRLILTTALMEGLILSC